MINDKIIHLHSFADQKEPLKQFDCVTDAIEMHIITNVMRARSLIKMTCSNKIFKSVTSEQCSAGVRALHIR